MKALIVSKTKMKNAVCVGALSLESNRNIRLLNPGNKNQPEDTEFEIGQLWDIKFIDRNPKEKPHTEDVIVLSKSFIEEVADIADFLKSRNINLFKGSPRTLFDGKLEWYHNGSGFIAEDKGMPEFSVCFWESDKDLELYYSYKKARYKYDHNISFPFVGLVEPINIIEKGTLLRVSLTRPFDKDKNGKLSSWLQLSGWYSDRSKYAINNACKIIFDENFDDYHSLLFIEDYGYRKLTPRFLNNDEIENALSYLQRANKDHEIVKILKTYCRNLAIFDEDVVRKNFSHFVNSKYEAFCYFLIGSILYTEETEHLANKYFLKAVKIDNQYALAFAYLGSSSNDTDKELHLYNKSLNIEESAHALLSRGLLYLYRKSEFIKAIVDFTSLLEYLESNKDKTHKKTNIYYYRGIANYKSENFQSAVEDFNKADSGLDISKRENPNEYRAFAKAKLGDYEGAIKEFENPIRVLPNRAFLYRDRGIVKLIFNRLQDAIDDFNIALKLYPEYNDALELKEKALKKLKHE